MSCHKRRFLPEHLRLSEVLINEISTRQVQSCKRSKNLLKGLWGDLAESAEELRLPCQRPSLTPSLPDCCQEEPALHILVRRQLARWRSSKSFDDTIHTQLEQEIANNDKKTKELRTRDVSIRRKEVAFLAKYTEFQKRNAELDQREADLDKKQIEIHAKKTEFDEQMNTKQQDLLQWEQELNETAKQIQDRDSPLAKRKCTASAPKTPRTSTPDPLAVDSDVKTFKCIDCDMSFDTEWLRKHHSTRVHAKTLTSCVYLVDGKACDYKYKYRATLESHVRSKHKLVVCSICVKEDKSRPLGDPDAIMYSKVARDHHLYEVHKALLCPPSRYPISLHLGHTCEIHRLCICPKKVALPVYIIHGVENHVCDTGKGKE